MTRRSWLRTLLWPVIWLDRRIAHHMKLQTLGDWVFNLLLFGLPWAYIWHSDVLAPMLIWPVSQWLGIGPEHPVLTEGMMRWRRTWSSGLFGGGIFFATVLYAKHVWQRRRSRIQ